MKHSQMSDLAKAEANALGDSLAGLKNRLVQNPVVSLIAGSGALWFLLGRRKPATLPQRADVQRWEDEGGAVIPPDALPDALPDSGPESGPVSESGPETTLMQVIGPGIGALALGVVAATLLPRTKAEDKTLGPTGGALRNHAGLMGDAAVAVLGVVLRQAGAEVLHQWERSFNEMLDGLAAKPDSQAPETGPETKTGPEQTSNS